MPTKVTSNGRVTVPNRVRDYLGIEPGTEVAFRRAADGSIVIERADGTRPPSRFEKLRGIAGPVRPPTKSGQCCVGMTRRWREAWLRRIAISNERPIIGGLRPHYGSRPYRRCGSRSKQGKPSGI
jgi:antitoxin PrlF